MKNIYVAVSLVSVVAAICFNATLSSMPAPDKKVIAALLDNWHTTAAKADHKGYFGKIADDGHYIGTDATENWDKKAFEAFSKPYFDKGKAWDFKAVERHIYFSEDGRVAWFDELLDTWMKGCRGSGVLEWDGNEWKIKHYVLSMTVPNDVTNQVIPMKAKYEDDLIEKLKAGKN